MITLEFTTKEIVSANGRYHPIVKNNLMKALRSKACLAAQGLPMFKGHVWVRVFIEWPQASRKRDAQNLQPTFKACVDGFTDAGLWPDDDDEHVTGPHGYATTKKAGPKLVRLHFVFTEYPSRGDVPGAPKIE